MIRRQFSETLAVDGTSVACDCGFDPAILIVINDGPNVVYVQFDRNAATVADSFPLKKNETLSFDAFPQSDGFLGSEVNLICSVAETASVRLLALLL